MSRHDDDVRLRHMLDHAREAATLASGHERADLFEQRQLELALVRLLEVVGEAAARVSPSTQASLPDIPWAQIIGLRHRLIHGYDDVDYDILWQIVTADIHQLIAELERRLPPHR
jgi:uncharacterized protein with HEPN domain